MLLPYCLTFYNRIGTTDGEIDSESVINNNSTRYYSSSSVDVDFILGF